MRILSRLALTLVGYLAAVYFAGFSVACALYFGAPEAMAAYKEGFVFYALVSGNILAKILFVPAVLFVLVAEMIPLRKLIYYVLFGAALGGLFSAITGAGQWILIGLFGGIVSGFIYWAIAGRSAGLRQPKTL